jgi:hypothetical protein
VNRVLGIFRAALNHAADTHDRDCSCPADADIAPIRDAGPAWRCPGRIALASGQFGIALVYRTCRTRGAPSSVWPQSHRANRNHAASSQPIVTS